MSSDRQMVLACCASAPPRPRGQRVYTRIRADGAKLSVTLIPGEGVVVRVDARSVWLGLDELAPVAAALTAAREEP